MIAMGAITRLHKLLKEQAITDPLTGLHNRTLLTESLGGCIARHRQLLAPMSLVLLDVDDLK